MSLISEGIDKVAAYELPAGIYGDGRSFALPRAVLVRWSSRLDGKLYQIYVNGEFAGVTADDEQREIIVTLPSETATPVRIEVFAVEAGQGSLDHSGELEKMSGWNGRVRISILRSQELPLGSYLNIYYDRGSGEIDFDNALNEGILRVWQSRVFKAGFGLDGFGECDFGYDPSGAAGFGVGCFGMGQFGLDADVIEWTSPELAAGVYRFAVKAFDAKGWQIGVIEMEDVTVIPAARPAEGLDIFSYDSQTNWLLISVI